MKEQKAIEVSGGGIRCDAKNCDWKDDSISLETDLEPWLGKPCPNCGSNLLTRFDYYVHRFLLWVIRSVNNFIGPVDANLPETTLKIETRGNNSIRMKQVDPNPHSGDH